MTKRHFIAIAAMIKAELADISTIDPDVARTQKDMIRTIAEAFSDLAEQENNRFDRDRFMSACGF